MTLPEALELAASALSDDAEAIRPANGDPARLLARLDETARSRVLTWLLAHEPDAAEELAEAWAGEATGQAALLAVDEVALPKSAGKRLRRLRHRLRSRGVAVPEAVPAPTVAHLPEVDETLGGAFVTALGPTGARQVWWLDGHPSGGIRVFEALIDDALGVLRFEVYEATRSEARRFLKRIVHGEPPTAFAVPSETAQALVLRAAAAPGAGTPPRRWVEWRGRFDAALGARVPGDLVQEALPVAAEREAVARAVERIGAGAIGPWPPGRERLAALVEQLRTLLDSPLVVSPAAKREQIATLVAETAAELFGGQSGAVAAHRLRETAYVFWRLGDEAGAAACLAAATSLASEAAGESPVARAFVERWLAPLLAGSGRTAATPAAETSRLVRP